MEDLGETSDGTTGALTAPEGAVVGTRLQRLGDYRILQEIGRGGMGVVCEEEAIQVRSGADLPED
jgi:hypothetical protein